MEKKRLIKKLQACFTPYEVLWEEWQKCNFCSLNAEEIRVINFHRRHSFKLVLLRFFSPEFDTATLLQVIKKLELDFSRHKEWLVMKFVFSLIKLTRGKGREAYEEYIDNLEIPHDIKKVLFQFGVYSINDFLERYNEKDLEKPPYKEYVEQFLVLAKTHNLLFIERKQGDES